MPTSSPLDHLAGGLDLDPHTFMPDVWEVLLQEYNPKSVVDIGCGGGAAAKWFKDKGLSVTGIDGHPRFVTNTRIHENFVLHDFTKGPLIVDEFDMAWSSEFLEHVEERYLDGVMLAFSAAKHACITHAIPGQGGAHHVNEQPTVYWIGAFASAGFRYDDEMTNRLRSMGPKAPYARPTLTMFHRYDA